MLVHPTGKMLGDECFGVLPRLCVLVLVCIDFFGGSRTISMCLVDVSPLFDTFELFILPFLRDWFDFSRLSASVV